ncbi:NADH-ubiquinone oxidoreductase chain N [hydrothermal vent metagenome]|uniref:NADH-ubiquinone oxidoreductase chain N n=1 Tax=hydrothermal vent metagenome TaxID=652676 RepID=A0A3B1BRG5_9ZZZZ
MTAIPIPDISLGAIASEITLVISAVVVMMLEVFAEKKGRDHIAYISLVGVIVACFITFRLAGDPSWTTFSGLYVVDRFGQFFKLICLLGTGMTILVSVKYNKDENIDNGEYYALLLFATSGMLFMVSGSDMITIFMGLEVMSISLYALAGYTRKRARSNEASVKYFILGSLSTAFLLYGIALIYGSTGSTQIDIIAKAVSSGSGVEAVLDLGIVMLMIGFAFKVSAVPFHMWTPDVYQGAPTPVTAFMSAGPKAAAFAAFFRVFNVAFPSLQTDWWVIIWILAVATMTCGNVIALLQNDVKRMLAYSSIGHAGYILVGFVAGGALGSSAILYYMLVYTFMNIGAFAIVTVVGRKGEEKTKFSDFTGLGYRYPLMAVALVIFLFSLAGIPPTAGFVGKFYIFMAALKQGYVYLAIIGVLNSVISIFYYLRLSVVMYMRDEPGEDLPPLVFAPSLIAAMIVAIYGSLWLGIMPAGYISFAQSAFLAL